MLKCKFFLHLHNPDSTTEVHTDLLQRPDLYAFRQTYNACACSVTHSHSDVSVLLFCPFAVSDAALDILVGEQGSSVFGSMGADV